MYLKFNLPKGASGQAAAFANNLINTHLHSWADQHNIAYTKKIHKYTIRITFDNDMHYSVFAMTWAPESKYFKNYLLDYQFIEPMNSRHV